ncbi:MAG: methyltransferase domain-containing protein [Deltaproteobacteria bacterium]|nr:methyltransferase domain-containing protein [Deltaproteobacteria bacterium]
MIEKAIASCKMILNAVFDYLFYLPFGGEAAFRRTCMDFIPLTDGDALLELCCGVGEFTAVLARQKTAGRLVGVDISGPSIESAGRRLRYTKAGFLLASAADLPFSSGTFEKCVVSFGMHHMPMQERTKSLKEMHRILVREGKLYIFDYRLPENCIKKLAAIAYTHLDSSKEAYRMMISGSLFSEIEDAGFEIVRQGFTCYGIVQLLEIRKNRRHGLSIP